MKQLIEKLEAARVRLTLAGDQLKLKAESGGIPSALLAEVKQNKTALVRHLRKEAVATIPVKVHEGAHYYELSHFQQEIWLNAELYASRFFHQARPFLLEGALDRDALESATGDLLDRYEILRTTFHLIDGQPYQRVNRRESLSPSSLECLAEGVESLEQALAWVKEQRGRVYDLARGPLFRAALLRLGEDRHLFVLFSHHIVMDGWSSNIAVQYLVARYLYYTEGRPADFAPLDFQYKEFAALQNRQLAEEQLSGHRQFWTDYLAGELPRLHLTTDYQRPSVKTFRGKRLGETLDADLSARLKEYCQRKGVTPFIFFQALVKVLLFRYTRQTDLIVGSVFAGRDSVGMEQQVGTFANILPVRTRIKKQETFAALLERVKRDMFAIYSHQFYPFSRILKDLNLSFDKSHSPLFDVSVVVQNFQPGEEGEAGFGDVRVRPLDIEEGATTQDLGFIFSEKADGRIEIDVFYNSDLFRSQRIETLKGHVRNLLETTLEDDRQPLTDLNLLSGAEKRELLHDFNNTSAGLPPFETILELFGKTVAEYPANIALVSNDTQLTYRELHRQSDDFAAYLRHQHQVKPGDFVGVLTGRTHLTILALLGAMKAGAVYMPLEEDLPAGRIEEMCRLVDARRLISTTSYRDRLEGLDHPPLVLIDRPFEPKPASGLPPEPVAASEPAYIIFTSGSTGKPKPIVAKHEGLINNVWDYMPKLGVTPSDNYLQFFSTGFDGFFFDLFPLLCGATLVMVEKKIIGDREKFLQYLEEHEVTMTGMTPSYLKALDRPAFPTLRVLISAGEAVDTQTAVHYAARKQFFNLYGPAEATVIASFYEVESGRAYPMGVPIGKPCANKQLYVLDEDLNLLPKGVPGELCISGAGVVDGYWQEPERTAERFVLNPFKPGKMLYRTGDQARWLEDGNLLFLGRIDNQVKINGYRVEPGEIEEVLSGCWGVSKAVVLALGENGRFELAGFYQSGEPGNGHPRTPESLRRELTGRLPAYMVPGRLLEVREWPVTAQGKIDRKKLIALAEEAVDRTAEPMAPVTETQKKIQTIWQALLSRENIGIRNLFFEVGGDSLLAIRMISAIRDTFEVELEVRDIFGHPTIESLARRLEEVSQDNAAPPLRAEPRPERLPLSYAQERLWFLDQLGGSQEYHIPMLLRLRRKVDERAFLSALKDLAQHHEALRTVIRTVDGKPFQEILPPEAWSPVRLKEDHFAGEEELMALVREQIQRPFDLAHDPPFRAHLIHCGPDDYLLVLVVHHIASDGWSQSLIIQDLLTFYRSRLNGKEPARLMSELQYADYAVWQRQDKFRAYLSEQLEWWVERLEGVSPLQLPTDFPRPAVRSKRGASLTFRIDPDPTRRLKDLSNGKGATLFMTLLAAFKVLLYRYSGQDDICVGTPVANRNHRELESMVGLFINTLALRSNLGDNPAFTDLLERVKSNTLAAFARQEVPFEEIVDRVDKERSLGRSPLFQVMFVMHNTPGLTGDVPSELELSFEPIEQDTSKFEMTWSVAEDAGGLAASIVYCPDLFSRSSIEQMARHFEMLLGAIVHHPDEKIDRLDLLSPGDRRHLITELNDTAVDFPLTSDTGDPVSVVALFQEQAAKTPDATALIGEEREMTYGELAQRAGRLALHLIDDCGVRPDDRVGLLMERSDWAIVAMLGILRAGAAYVPIDTAYPDSRKAFIMADTGMKVLLTLSEDRPAVGAFGVQTVAVDQLEAATEGSFPCKVQSGPDDLVYIIYTSGSTGRPKGVMIEQRSLLNYLFFSFDHYGKDLKAFHFPLFTSLSFDLTQTCIFLTLLSGGALTIRKSGDTGEVLKELMRSGRINAVKLTPSHTYFLEGCRAPGLRLAIVGGERLERTHLERLRALNKDLRIYNEYGPTEATIGCTVQEIDAVDAPVTIGRPIANTEVYLMDKYGSLTAPGVPGELCIGGAGLARGYLNRPALTKEKFISHPFSEEEKARLYRSGDLARWRPDGVLEYLGRLDTQVKVRGYRIEPGEVEAVLGRCSGVREGVIQVREGTEGHKQLVAYVVPAGPFDEAAIRRQLLAELPDYMVPTALVELEAIPLTVHGKLDTKALPGPGASVLAKGEFKAPESETEVQLAQIWRELLHLDQVGVHDNFFELGGDSIITIQVVSRAGQLGYSLQPKDLFLNPTISGLAELLSNRQERSVLAEQGKLEGPAPLLPIQQWFFEREHPAMFHYNQSVLLQLEKGIGPEQLSRAVDALVDRHDALRFSYRKGPEGWMQVYSDVEGELEVIDLSTISPAAIRLEITRRCEDAQANLDPENGRAFRALLLQTPASESHHRLFLVAHHLVIDGVSWRILLDDLASALALPEERGNGFGEKGSSFRQWGEFLIAYAASRQVTAQFPFWQSVVEAYRPLPVDREGEAAGFGALQSYSVRLTQTLTRALLQEVHSAYHTGMDDILLSAVGRTIGKWTGFSEVVVGLESHGRADLSEEIDTSNTVGWFTSLYPVVLPVEEQHGTGDLIREVKEHLRRIPDKGIGFGLLRYFHPSREVRESLSQARWDILFNYLGQIDSATEGNRWFSRAEESRGPSIRDDYPVNSRLLVNGMITGGELVFNWSFTEHHYRPATVARLADQYIAHLTELITHCMEKQDESFTPADLGLSGEISYQELDALNEYLEGKETDGDEILKF